MVSNSIEAYISSIKEYDNSQIKNKQHEHSFDYVCIKFTTRRARLHNFLNYVYNARDNKAFS